jgi:homospermidine synthase
LNLYRLGLIDIAERIIKEKPTDARVPLLKDCLEKRNYSLLSQTVGVKAIQISEWDDQRSRTFEKGKNQFISSWNVLGFCEEMAASAEFPWGTHETEVPFKTGTFKGKVEGEKSFYIAGQPAERTWTKSCIPGKGDFVGMVCHHEETITISNFLSMRSAEGKLEYQPTVYFSYRPCEMALQSAREFAANKYVLAPNIQQKILFEEITDGADSLGVFLLGHDFKGWWIGSLLDIHQTRNTYKNGAAAQRVNSTSLQVAISTTAAICWMIEHPNVGVHFPETIDSQRILDYSKPYLGNFVSTPVDWQPVPGNSNTVWQFSNFVSPN